jgi:hypothetical protein
MSAAGLNLLVFREGRKCVPGWKLTCGLLQEVSNLNSAASGVAILRGLLRSGELECATADAGLADPLLEEITDQLAAALVGAGVLPTPNSLASSIAKISSAAVPDQVTISTPEGFAYYGLHPLAYADVFSAVPLVSDHVLVVGIRSIGTTLSAVTTAEARKKGKTVRRTTVRPQGHPYNRETRFSPEQRELIRRELAYNADFLVVDEGPGLSGSSFLSVADALITAGVAREKITLICGHEPNFAGLCCNDGPRRAQQFRWLAVPPQSRRPDGALADIGGGEWRRALLPDQASWPASWTTFERAKYLTAPNCAEPRLFKFAGFGHYGDLACAREALVSASGLGPDPRLEADGFVSYPKLPGRPMSASDLNQRTILRLAGYCALREREFKAPVNDLNSLQQMAEHNLAELGFDLPLNLRLERPVIADGRLQPHEWLLLPDGIMIKTDCGSHGDDHFFPGPTDIAWDLAGAIVEWHMNHAQSEAFLARYRSLTEDHVESRINDFIVAYSVFRSAYCMMAASAVQDNTEKLRLQGAAAGYRKALLAASVAAMGA